jgi:hypothetical protein
VQLPWRDTENRAILLVKFYDLKGVLAAKNKVVIGFVSGFIVREHVPQGRAKEHTIL